MKGIDTNILVRYLTQDDQIQAAKVNAFIEKCALQKSSIFLNWIVICETVWVLESCYQVGRQQMSEVLEKILRTKQFCVEDSDQVWAALLDFKKNKKADFVDCVIGRKNMAKGCENTLTFDKGLKSLTLFEVLS